jgi:hypothetical protein
METWSVAPGMSMQPRQITVKFENVHDRIMWSNVGFQHDIAETQLTYQN